MPFFTVSSCFAIVFLVVVDYGVSIQLNLYLTEWPTSNGDNSVTQHDCLLVDSWEKEIDIHEITPYCMSEWPSKWNIQKNDVDQKYSFAQLFALNITSEQLYLWSAPLDIVEQYQFYLDQVLTLNETAMTTYWFFNCTGLTFGSMCQYSFDQDDSSSSSSYPSLNTIIYEFYFRDEKKPINSTCYTHLQCDLGLTSLCISWVSVCDGVIQCINGTDEENCWQLEINECNDDQFRCTSGHCISWSFFNDKNSAFDCFDGSDENFYLNPSIYSDLSGPLYKLDHMLRYQRSTGASLSTVAYMCSDLFRPGVNKLIFSIEKPKALSHDCWSTLSCYLIIIKPINDSNCSNICQANRCKEIIEKECPDMFFIPDTPIAFGHIYFAYTKESILNQIVLSAKPQYICYNEQLCGGSYSNKTPIPFNNTICRRPEDLSRQFLLVNPHETTLCYYIDWTVRFLYNCNTLPAFNSAYCDNSTMYQCMNSSKCIAQIRLFDGLQDCDYGDDEERLSTDHYCPIRSRRMYFNCTMENKCISHKLFADGLCDCGSEMQPSCDDELLAISNTALHISFPHICDRIPQLDPILINGQEETDETECELWPCNNIYTRCNGRLDCLNGDDELDCHPASFINCPFRSFVCFSFDTFDYMCLSANKLNDGNVDCVGGLDEVKLCPKFPQKFSSARFVCGNTSRYTCLSRGSLCSVKHRCLSGDSEYFCDQIKNPELFDTNGICVSEDASFRSDKEEFLCNYFKDISETMLLHFSLGRMRRTDKDITKSKTNMALKTPSTSRIDSQHQHHCHRHSELRVWLNKNDNLTRMTCLCPPSHYGDRCQYQNQRVSLTIQFQAFSDSWQTPFIIVVLLIDDSDDRTIHSHEQLTYLPVPNCKTKYNMELLYSIRPKNQSRQYSVHMDIFEKLTSKYRGSFLIILPFPFMPVQRVAVQLKIPITDYNFLNCSSDRCFHGRCSKYYDDPKYSTFCQCNAGWSGRYCTIPQNCTCSSDSLCIGRLASNRSLCVCPVNKWGPRCLLHDAICRSNTTCHNNGRCIPVDRYVASNQQFVCVCPKGYSGEICEVSQNTIILSFEKDMILPPWMLIHFIEVKSNAPPENGTTFKNIPVDRNSVIIYWSRPFHIAFVEIIPQNYYSIVVKNLSDRSNTTETTLQSSSRCLNITEIFNETFVQLHLIRRIKYYHLVCQQHTPQLSCFYDEVHLCLCTDFYRQRQANCFEFDHKLKRNCRGQSNCENDAECLQDNANCPQTSICICPRCFYGARCQFSSRGFGLSLDAILGDRIQPHVSIRYQPVIIQISVTLMVLITVMGLINGVLSVMTFINRAPRKTGCGLYLFVSSITTLLISVLLCIKFCILLVAQMTYMANRSFLLFQCRSVDFILRTSLSMDQWLNACVAIERAVTVTKGVNFDKTKSKKIAKFIISSLLLLTAGTHFPEIIYRHLLDDTSNDQQRIWCIVNYSSSIQFYNLIMNIFHFCAPFLINLLSAIIIIIKTTRLRKAARIQKNYREVLLEQLQQHKHLLIAPFILVILAVPRLIISFVSGCMQSSADAWLFLMGYFISFTPPILTFFIFVVPSKMYKEEFYNTVKRYQRTLQARSHLFR